MTEIYHYITTEIHSNFFTLLFALSLYYAQLRAFNFLRTEVNSFFIFV